MRVLDEVADAIRIARGGRTVPVHTCVLLREVLGDPITPAQWAALQRHLGGVLPPLVLDQGHWFRTDDFETVWDLAEYVARLRRDWEPVLSATVADWQNAQIFAGVRVEVAGAGNLDATEVVREARLMRDLSLE
jgi:hypothetical protein